MLLDVELTRVLPGVIGVGEEDGLGANRGGDGLDGGGLLSGTGDSGTVGATGVGPASLEVDDVLAATELLEDLELALGELTGLLGGDIGVEEGVDVGTDDVDGAAKSAAAVLLPDVDGLGGSDGTGVAGSLEALGGGLDEGAEGSGVDVAGLDGLVTDNDQLDHVPRSPLGDLGDLLLGAGDAGAVDVDTHDDAEAELLAGVTDELETAAVSGVDTDQVEALALDDLEVLENLLLGLALTTSGVGGVSHTVLPLTKDGGNVAGLADGGGGAGAGAGAGAGGADNGSGSGGGSHGSGDSRGSGRGQGVSGSRADVGVVSAGHSDDGLILGVGTRDNGLRGGVDQNGAGGHRGGGRRHNGVGTSSGADVGGGLNDAGHGAAGGLDGGVGAGDSGGSLDNGGNTTVSVGAAGDVSGGGTADSGGVVDSDGGGRDGVNTGGGESANTGSGQLHDGSASNGGARRNRGRGRRARDSHGQSAGAGRVQSAGESAGGLGDGSRGRGGRGRGHSLDGDQGSVAVVGDDLGGATAGLFRGSSDGGGPDAGCGLATLVEGVMATVNTVGHGRADQGGGGDDRSLHDWKDNINHAKE